jgi:hypothetical protein
MFLNVLSGYFMRQISNLFTAWKQVAALTQEYVSATLSNKGYSMQTKTQSAFLSRILAGFHSVAFRQLWIRQMMQMMISFCL